MGLAPAVPCAGLPQFVHSAHLDSPNSIDPLCPPPTFVQPSTSSSHAVTDLHRHRAEPQPIPETTLQRQPPRTPCDAGTTPSLSVIARGWDGMGEAKGNLNFSLPENFLSPTSSSRTTQGATAATHSPCLASKMQGRCHGTDACARAVDCLAGWRCAFLATWCSCWTVGVARTGCYSGVYYTSLLMIGLDITFVLVVSTCDGLSCER